MRDDLGNRMKSNYEDITRIRLPRRTHTILRIDGKAFHTYTKKLQKPFDPQLMNDMDATAQYLCENIQGAKLAYVQSDEISVFVTDFDSLQTDAWFDGNIQKQVSIAASLATAKFNQLRTMHKCYQYDLEYPYKDIEKTQIKELVLAHFDARVFTIPELEEVTNYFIWRQKDAERNSIQMLAQSVFPHKTLQGKNCSELRTMLEENGTPWEELPVRFKRGGAVVKQATLITSKDKEPTYRSKWILQDPPIFTEDRDFIRLKVTKPWELAS